MKLKNLVENFELARYALQYYPHDADTLDAWLPRFRISSNAVYPYQHEGRLCFLRLASVEEKDLSPIQAEIEFILYLRAKHYPAMKPIANHRNEYAFHLDSPWGAYCVSAFEGVPGMPIEDSPVTPALIYAYGRALGQLHVLSSKYCPKTNRPAWNEILSRQQLLEAGSSEAVLIAADALFTSLGRLPATPDCYGLIHYDFEPDNVFWDEGSCTLSVIDFDDCIYGWYAMDIAQVLDCLGDLSAQDLSAGFLAGYRSVRPFSPEQEAQIPLMRRYIDLRKIARLKHCLSEEVTNPPEWMRDLRKRLENALESLTRRIIS